ncbi:MAG TPA: DUF4118 domain-containing protein [Acidimicrobiales bacterium]|nr:DUF4118 domain-containing protein [Acidimicrobiales bacterium]
MGRDGAPAAAPARSARRLVLPAVALCGPLVVAAVLVPFRDDLSNAAAALVLVAVVVAVASFGNRAAGYVATVSSVVWFDFFLTQPYERFAISHRDDIETAVGLFVVGVAVTEIAVRRRHHREAATTETGYVGLIKEVSGLAAAGTESAFVVRRVEGALTELLSLRSCRFETAEPARPEPRIEESGRVVFAEVVWPVGEVGLPGREVELEVRHRDHRYGRFALEPTPGEPLDDERLGVAVVLANLVGAVLADEPRPKDAGGNGTGQLRV